MQAHTDMCGLSESFPLSNFHIQEEFDCVLDGKQFIWNHLDCILFTSMMAVINIVASEHVFLLLLSCDFTFFETGKCGASTFYLGIFVLSCKYIETLHGLKESYVYFFHLWYSLFYWNLQRVTIEANFVSKFRNMRKLVRL